MCNHLKCLNPEFNWSVTSGSSHSCFFHLCDFPSPDAAAEWMHQGAATSSLQEAAWDKGRRCEAQRRRRIAAKSQRTDAVQEGGGGRRRAEDTHCYSNDCSVSEGRHHHLLQDALLREQRAQPDQNRNASELCEAGGKPSAPPNRHLGRRPRPGASFQGLRCRSLGTGRWGEGGLWDGDEGRSHVQAAPRRRPTAQLSLHRPPPSSLPITSAHRCPQAHFASTFLC